MRDMLRPIFLIEDDPNDVELTLSALEASGLANPVTVARDGTEALAALAVAVLDPATTPVVVLLDVKLPGLSGIEVLAKLKADDTMRLLPIVMLTSSRQEQDLVRTYGLGVNGYVVKPLAHPEFLRAIRDIGAYWAVLNETPGKSKSNLERTS